MYTFEEIKQHACTGVSAYNQEARAGRKLSKVSLFGSYASGAARDNSDVDLLISFESDTVSLFDLAHVLMCMEDQFGEDAVDIVEEKALPETFLIVENRIPLYG